MRSNMTPTTLHNVPHIMHMIRRYNIWYYIWYLNMVHKYGHLTIIVSLILKTQNILLTSETVCFGWILIKNTYFILHILHVPNGFGCQT